MERCAELCVESLSDEHVMKFYTLGDRYGLPDLCEKCYEYLKCRFWRLSRKLSFLCSVRLTLSNFTGIIKMIFMFSHKTNEHPATLDYLRHGEVTLFYAGMIYSLAPCIHSCRSIPTFYRELKRARIYFIFFQTPSVFVKQYFDFQNSTKLFLQSCDYGKVGIRAKFAGS